MDATKPMARPKAWVGVDVGKGFHWAVVVDAEGEVLLSRKVENEEADLSTLVDEILAISSGEELCWAVDQPGGGAALLLALLWGCGQRVLYIPGLAVDRARDGFRGEAKTDRRYALVIAEQARMRRDLKPLEPTDELLSEMGLLLARRRDLVEDQSRALQRLRDILLTLFPGAWSGHCQTCVTGVPSSCSGATRHLAASSVPGASASRRT
jgi:transposase